MTDHSFYEALTAWGTVFSGIATFLAVAVALYLGIRERFVRGKGSLDFFTFISDTGAPSQNLLVVDVTNLGAQTFVVGSFGLSARWRILARLGLSPTAVVFAWQDSRNTVLPAEVSPDGTARMMTAAIDLAVSGMAACIERMRCPPWLSVHLYRPYATTPRATLPLALGKKVQNRLQEEVRKIREIKRSGG